jgi:uncharacterized protein (DUF58 family)
MARCLALGAGFRLLALAFALALALLLPATATAASCPAWTLGLSLKGGGGKRGTPSVTAGRKSTILVKLRNPGPDAVVNATLILDMNTGIDYVGKGAKQAADGSAATAPPPRHADNGKGFLVVKDPTDLLWLWVNVPARKTRTFRVKTKVNTCMPPLATVDATAFFVLDDGTPVHVQDCLITAHLDVRKTSHVCLCGRCA